MTDFSLGTIWEETIAFLRREGSLLIPVALATFGIAQLLLELGMAGQAADGAAMQAPTPQALLLLPAGLLLLIGNLAVTRIVLMPGKSIGESLADSLRATPKALVVMAVIFAIMVGVVLLIVIAATLGAMTFRVDPRTITPSIVSLLVIPIFVISIRLLVLIPILAVEQLGPIAALRRAWALSRQHFLRFLGVFGIVMLLTMILALVKLFVLGSLFQILGMVVSDAQLVAILQGLVNAGLTAMLSLAATLYIALIYKRVAGS